MLGKIMRNIINRFTNAAKVDKAAEPLFQKAPEERKEQSVSSPINYRNFRIKAYCNLKKLEYGTHGGVTIIFQNSKAVRMLFEPSKKELIDALREV